MRRVFAVLVTAAVFLSAGCSKQALPVRPEGPPPEKGPITIRLGHYAGYEPQLDVLITAFQQQHPGYRVEKVLLPNGDQGPVTLMVLNGQLDVTDSAIWMVSEKTVSSALVALDTYIQRDRLKLQSCGGALEQGALGGRHYVLPYIRYPQVILANKALLAKAGVEVDPAAGWTWEEFRGVAARLSHGAGEERVWGFATRFPAGLAKTMVEDRTNLPFRQAPAQAFTDPLGLLSAMTLTDRSMPLPVTYEPAIGKTSTLPDLAQEVRAGRIAMAEWGLLQPAQNQYGEEVVILPFPSYNPATAMTPSSVRELAVVANGPHPDDAWLFVRFAAGPEGAAVLARAGYLPACLNESMQQTWEALQPPAATRHFFTTRWTGYAFDFGDARQLDRLMKATQEALTGKRPVDEVLKRYAGGEY